MLDTINPSKVMATSAWQAANTKNAEEPVLLELGEICSYADYVLILSGRSARQVEAIAEAVEVGMKERGYDPIGREGERGSNWMLVDFGDVVVHVFHESVREYYDIEGLWIDAQRVDLEIDANA